MMNMDHSTGNKPWLTMPIRFHSDRNSYKCKLTPEQCAYQTGHWRFWYRADLVYSLNTIYLCCAIIGVFTIANILARYAPEKFRRNRVWRATASAFRYLSYRGFRAPAIRYWSPSLGVMLLGAVGAIFFFAMTLGPKPYYWPSGAWGNSPPIATRAGWMALALLPFIFATSVKANMITALTGIPHEKLQVFHHWLSYAMFVLALVHTFPFIVFHVAKGDMMHKWKTDVVYWTGVVALLAQTYLTVMSFPTIRNRFYEFFKATHMIAAVLFMVFFFFHCNAMLTSWDYFIASGALYFASLIAANIRTYLLNGLHTARIEMLPSGLIRVAVPTFMNWTPGQHVYVRFLTSDLHLLTAHPFTISSVYNDPLTTGIVSELIFYIKPRGGVTGRIAAMAKKQPGCSKKIYIEGPYGGVNAHNLARFDTLLVIAGGSGGGFSLAMVDEALRLSELETKGEKPEHRGRRNLQVVFSTRDREMGDWYAAEIESRMSHSTTLSSSSESESGFETSVSVHVTSAIGSSAASSPSIGSEKNPKAPAEVTTTGSFSLNVHRNARPDIPGLLARTVAMAHSQGNFQGRKQRIGVLVCGPASMLHDTRNAAAIAQKRAMSGDVEEVYLHSEPFAW